MARDKGFIATMVAAAKEAERERLRVQRAEAQAARELERSRKALERAAAAGERERKRLYLAIRTAEVDARNDELQNTLLALDQLLVDTLGVDNTLDFESLKPFAPRAQFDPGELGIANPPPTPPSTNSQPLLLRLLPGGRARALRRDDERRRAYETVLKAHGEHEQKRLARVDAARREYEHSLAEATREWAQRCADIDVLHLAFDAGERDAVAQYFQLVLATSPYPDGFPQRSRLSYSPESRQLAVEYELPTIEVVPVAASYKYVKARDEIVTVARPATQRRSSYRSVVAHVALRTVHEIFEADRAGHVDTVVFNGHVTSVDPATGRDVHPCVVTMRTTRDAFADIDLARVEPLACLKALHASVSKNPSELVPVRPVLDFSMVDPRFIEESDVLASLDDRPNLMELTPTEFEALITNLFERMGLETRQTQASRDGGVDCVAFNNDPVLGGKVVIQAKRYRHTVGVSAVRDLFGTVQNEGASKGILVTTSGYGKASYDFVANKPLELFDGANLLYLLAQHAHLEARIEMPDDWVDAEPDRQNED